MANIVNYLDVISLERVKTYLRFDATSADIDLELTAMINAACKVMEGYTNYRLMPQELIFYFLNGKIRIYDFPIVEIITPNDSSDYKRVDSELYIELTDLKGMEASNLSIFVDVGYTDTDEVNPILIQAILETVRVWFFNSEQDAVKGVLPYTAMSMVSGIKRFIL